MDTCCTQNIRWGGENKFRSLVPPLVRYWGKCPPNLGGGPKDICWTTAAKLAEVVLFGGQMSSKFIVQLSSKCPPTTAATAKTGQMSSNHYRRRQMSSNPYQPLPPELVKCPATTAVKLDKCPPTTPARISQMSSNHCRQTWTNVLPTPPPKPNVLLRIFPLVNHQLRAAGSLREFPSCFWKGLWKGLRETMTLGLGAFHKEIQIIQKLCWIMRRNKNCTIRKPRS